jgi:hypothetical protein
VLSEQAQRVESPDEQWIAIVNEAAGSLALEAPDGTTSTMFPEGSTVGAVAWSPDGKVLLVERTNSAPTQDDEQQASGPPEIWAVRLGNDSVAAPALLFRPGAEQVEEQAPGGLAEVVFGRWAPGGRHVFLWIGASSSIRADGNAPWVLDTTTGDTLRPADWALVNPRYYSWAPDSSSLAVTVGGGRSVQVNKWLNIIDLNSGEVTTVISDTEQVPGIVAWSPVDNSATEDEIAYAAVPAEKTGRAYASLMTFENPAIAARRIYLLDPGTGEYRRLNDVDNYQDAPVWSSDGEQLYYVQRDRETETLVLMVADPETGEAQPIEASRRAAPPDTRVGYYGQAAWHDVLSYVPDDPVSGPKPNEGAGKSPSLSPSIPFTICQTSTTSTRPSEEEHAEVVWNVPRRQAVPRAMHWWQFQQDVYRYMGGNSEMFDMWSELGLWASDDPCTCAENRIKDIVTGRIVEVWTLNHCVLAAQRQGHVYTVTVDPAGTGYQVMHLPAPGVTSPITSRALITATLHLVDTAGREIDPLPETTPWNVALITREAVTVTSTAVDNPPSTQVMIPRDADGEQAHVPWIDTTIIQRPDGTRAAFQDIARGMVLEVIGFRRSRAESPNTLSRVRVSIVDEK